ncbi:hypothetical protein B9Z55_026629 [Caenorhabditis nigoni]|uniref:Uncharacterized protein n=1 Tax=Caenorhabditis nigoni TaxID=1611254 RepID=A0A2G5T462_9PELO|nr:hypothetical protein B9Z55_026629 [Caenorhabditis nigoni]
MFAFYFKQLRQQQNQKLCPAATTQIPMKRFRSRKSTPREEDFADADDIFVVDRAGGGLERRQLSVFRPSWDFLLPNETDKDLKELLDKAVVGPKFENNHQPQTRLPRLVLLNTE